MTTSIEKKKKAFDSITSILSRVINNGKLDDHVEGNSFSKRMFIDNDINDFNNIIHSIQVNYGEFISVKVNDNMAYISFNPVLGFFADLVFEDGMITATFTFIDFIYNDDSEDVCFNAPIQVKKIDDNVVLPAMMVSELCSLKNDIGFSSMIVGFGESNDILKPYCATLIISVKDYNSLVERYTLASEC